MKGLDLTAPFRQLVERKLWPLALLLVAAVAAVPLLLAREGEPPAPPAAAAPNTLSATMGATQPVVSVADAEAVEERRKVLGSAKDPFRPSPAPKAASVEPGETLSPAPDPGAGEPKAFGGGGAPAPVGGGGGGPADPGPAAPAPSVPVAQQPTAPKRVYELYSLIVRFGDSTADRLPKSNLKRLKAMPNADEPAVIYLGLMSDRKTAVFLVDAGTRVQGDGKCQPSPSNCQTLHLKVGETAFFDVEDGEGSVVRQYQLDLVKVARKSTTDATAARQAMTAEASGGRDALRKRMTRVGRYRYDPASGSVKRISRKAHRAAVARASAR